MTPKIFRVSCDETVPVGVVIVVTGMTPGVMVGVKVMMAVLVRFNFNLFDTMYSSMIVIDLSDVAVIPSNVSSVIDTKASSTYVQVVGSVHIRSLFGPEWR